MIPSPLLRMPSTRRSQGVALIVSLAVVVILSVLALAIFSRAISSNRVAQSSSSQTLTATLAQSALSVIIGDLEQEILAGSLTDADYTVNGIQVHIPSDPENAVPARSGVAADLKNVVKVSRRSTPFFAGSTYSGAGQASNRAAPSASTTPSVNDRRITAARWNKPRLMEATGTNGAPPATFEAPDWVLVTRDGSNPTTWSSALRDSGASNENFVIGRYAYVIYDVGNLLDINAAGHPQAAPAGEIARKGSLAFADLTQIGLTPEQIDALVGWRNFASAQPTASYPADGFPQFSFDTAAAQRFVDFAADNPNGFRTVSPLIHNGRTDQAFVGRQQLLELVDAMEPGTASGAFHQALPFLTTFSREVNAPTYYPDPTRARVDRAAPNGPDDVINPNLANIRATDGKPLLDQRFSLRRLELLEEPAANASEIERYFGLTLDGSRWQYRGGNTDRILKLSEIAAAGRDPDFFELLQAAILTGSLGKTSGETSAIRTDAYDSNIYYQIIQIGANVIDQADADDFPTDIVFNDTHFYGQENLPYVSEVYGAVYRPVANRNTLQGWYLFELWNSSQNAGTLPEGITGYRVSVVSGQSQLTTWYQNQANPNLMRESTLTPDNSTWSNLPSGATVNFPLVPPQGDYSEPVALGFDTTPDASNFPGILATELLVPNPAIPPRAEQDLASDQVQTWDTIAESAGRTHFGRKPYTRATLRPNESDPPTFVLEYERDGEWFPYQHIGEFVRAIQNINISNGSENIGQIVNNTADTDSEGSGSFHNWLQTSGPPSNTLQIPIPYVASDPRTRRFGLASSTTNATPNRTIRETINDWTISSTQLDTGWQILARLLPDDLQSTGSQSHGFEMTGTQIGAFRFGAIAGLATNTRGSLDANHTMRYPDPDGTIRVADAFFGAYPTVPNRLADRPVILNRPFRSVGELGYAFRDLPWKSLDFFSRESADAALLDVFSLNDERLVAGKVNLNTPHPEIVQAILAGAATRDLASDNPLPISDALSSNIATALVDQTQTTPLVNKADLVSNRFNPSASFSENAVFNGLTTKTERETAMRALAEVGSTRTWNFLIDLVVQSGRYTTNADSLDEFQVEGEKRHWLHVAIDRYTGEVVDSYLETIYE